MRSSEHKTEMLLMYGIKDPSNLIHTHLLTSIRKIKAHKAYNKSVSCCTAIT